MNPFFFSNLVTEWIYLKCGTYSAAILIRVFIVSHHEEPLWIGNSISGTHTVITARKLLAGGGGVGAASGGLGGGHGQGYPHLNVILSGRRMGVFESIVFFSSHARLWAQSGDRSGDLSMRAAGRRGRNRNFRFCPGFDIYHAPWTVNQVRFRASAAIHPPPYLSPFCPALTFVKWLPHPVAPEAAWSLIWSPKSPETQRARSEPGCADPGSDPRPRRTWPWRWWRETLWTSWRTCHRCTTSTRSLGTSPPPK